MAGRRRGRVTSAVLALLLVGAAGYATADVYDVAPGPLTAAPRPTPPPAFPTAPGAVVPTDVPDVLASVDESAPMPSAQVMASELGPLLAAPTLGKHVSASVVDALTGQTLYSLAAGTPREPASVTKVLTGAAALHRLGPARTLTTKVVQGVAADEVVLVAGGDVLLAAGGGDSQAVNGRAGLDDLATATAARLLQEGRSAVGVRLDDTMFSGPSMGPGWTQQDVNHGFVSPVSPIAVNAGRTRNANYAPRVQDPALSAAQTFAQRLTSHGVRVAGPVARAVAPADPVVLAEVKSAPVSDVVGFMLRVSDNNVAEALARLVALDVGRPGAFPDAAGAVLDQVSLLGLDTSAARLVDGSGLGDGSSFPPSLLTGLLSKAAAPDHPELRPLLEGLPIAGLTGTLSDRFAKQPAAAGLVRGKTGNLLGVTTLAGTVVDADGRLLAFAMMADDVPANVPARAALDDVAARIASCGCR
jgi:D-alanyl-D-alanine carboxypeptidase/D-alanyl-D-alanine-endopeptidase (penicillin-binding protein 4)